ncbi:M1 family metallopeptidase [Flavicella marina]|uniref:M1 family metallopeptidase n=1 Tax=Flavicella marina TaxID=1475951 RepID=UPI001264C61D|nr:M1 family metallopeptidase [Flavicella marina]
MRLFFALMSLSFSFALTAQNTAYWQQHVSYTMDIDMDVKNYQYHGKQSLIYTNNSPDVLDKVYYHLYFNAFQPGSEMDIRLQNIADPDGRMVDKTGTDENPVVTSRISKLTLGEIGFIKVNLLTQDGKNLKTKVAGTILEVQLATPINPGEKTTFEMDFLGQVPVQIRRSGRNNKEGVALSMAQWYPKMAEYDFEGWHANSYIAREFHGVWGDFDVTLHIDKKYIVGGSGYLQNGNEIGYGYEDEGVKVKRQKGKKLTWHFVAPNVHDFTWAADPKFQHDVLTAENDVKLHFLYKKKMDKEYVDNWKNLQPKTAELLAYYNKHIGDYPYKQYSVIQGGDGGMEYAMCTLVTGERSFGSLVGVVAHEMAHSWFQFVLATNESKHPWMDEGFTTYISNHAENEILNEGKENPLQGSYDGYFNLLGYGIEEPLTTQADAYHYNFAYGIGSYSKGSIFLSQLEYIIGKENVEKTLKKYYEDFKFKHPTPNDIKRTAEKVSGIQLDWYLNYWTQTKHTIDYEVAVSEGKNIKLTRLGGMPMPIDLQVMYEDGSIEGFYIPLTMMRGEKPTRASVLETWSWVAPSYEFSTTKTIKQVRIDVSGLMADKDLSNNVFPRQVEE